MPVRKRSMVGLRMQAKGMVRAVRTALVAPITPVGAVATAAVMAMGAVGPKRTVQGTS
jgi:hypothetical protein